MPSSRIAAILAVCGIAMSLAVSARADDASPWVEDLASSMRLIAGAKQKGTDYLRAGIEIKLKPGWHTYWRYPGDSGVPPRFSFSGSDNVATMKVLYAAPHAFTDDAGTTIGYKGAVIFPLRIFPRAMDKPVTLHLKIEYAVCEKLCVPVEANAVLTLPGEVGVNDAALMAAEAAVPKPANATDAGLTAKIASDNTKKPLVFVDLAASTGQPVELFVEGPTPEWALPVPKTAQGAPAGHQYFGFELDGLPPGINPKGPYELTFTIVTGSHATEVKTHLD